MADQEPPVLEVLGAFRMLMHYLSPERSRIGKTYGITPLHGITLFCIMRHEHCKMTDVAREFLQSPAAITRTVDALVAHGLVRRERDESDRRVVLLRITKKGSDAMGRGIQEIQSKLANILDRMNPKDRDALKVGLRALAVTLREMGEHDPVGKMKNRLIGKMEE